MVAQVGFSYLFWPQLPTLPLTHRQSDWRHSKRQSLGLVSEIEMEHAKEHYYMKRAAMSYATIIVIDSRKCS